jgi:hypothetical protein
LEKKKITVESEESFFHQLKKVFGGALNGKTEKNKGIQTQGIQR